jgi:hypothetical protein
MAQSKEAALAYLAGQLAQHLVEATKDPNWAIVAGERIRAVSEWESEPYEPDDEHWAQADVHSLMAKGVKVRRMPSSGAQDIVAEDLFDKARALGLTTADGNRVMLDYEQVVNLLRMVARF